MKKHLKQRTVSLPKIIEGVKEDLEEGCSVELKETNEAADHMWGKDVVLRRNKEDVTSEYSDALAKSMKTKCKVWRWVSFIVF